MEYEESNKNSDWLNEAIMEANTQKERNLLYTDIIHVRDFDTLLCTLYEYKCLISPR